MELLKENEDVEDGQKALIGKIIAAFCLPWHTSLLSE